MLLAPAEKAAMKTPADADAYDRNEYPHFEVYRAIQLGSPMPTPMSHWHNAQVIASIPDDKIRSVTFEELMALGIEVGFSTP